MFYSLQMSHLGSVQSREATMQVLPPTETPQRPVDHQWQKPFGLKECLITTSAISDDPRRTIAYGKYWVMFFFGQFGFLSVWVSYVCF